jgi:hypothetical protein
MRLGIVSLLFVVGCTGSPDTAESTCTGSDPSCNDAAAHPADASASEATPDDDSGSVTDSSADSADALCVLAVDDAGVTHGCVKGGMGPGDRDDGGGSADPPPPDVSPDAGDLPMGSSCWDNAQCASNICFDYAVRGTFCTQRCWTNANCPPPANGCNGMGVCRFGDGG